MRNGCTQSTRRWTAHHPPGAHLHGGDVNDLEFAEVKRSIRLEMHAHLVQDGQHGTVGLARTRGCTDEHVLS